MLTCDWARALTRYYCQPLTALDGGPCLEIGTPFSLPDGSAINLYLTTVADGMVKIGDNGDTLFQLGGMGLDVWQPARLSALRALTGKHRMNISPNGDISMLVRTEHAANGFALAVTGLLAVSAWAADSLGEQPKQVDILAEVQPYIIARNPSARFERQFRIKGASSTMYTFEMLHGNDLIDVINPSAIATGAAMRKAGDVQNGPYAEHMEPLIVVYDLAEPDKAMTEVSILGSVTRAVPASRLMQLAH